MGHNTMTLGERLRWIGFQASQRLRIGGVLALTDETEAYYGDPAANQRRRQERLAALLAHARAHVPFYRDHGGEHLENFPVIDKNIIREDPQEFQASGFDRSQVQRVTTSGSSGQPFECFHEREKVQRKLADILYYNRLVGYDVGLRHMLIRATAKPSWKLWLQNELWVDPTHWDDAFRKHMRSELLKGEIKVAIGYPSVMADLAAFCIENGDRPEELGLHTYIVTSEVITALQRDTIREAFDCEIASRYATEEFGVLGQSGPACLRFALNTHSLIIEVLKLNADAPAEDGKAGRVVVTDLFMRQMPLIRYDTGDLAVAERDALVYHGVAALTSLEGKTADVIYDTKGDKIAPLAVLVAFKNINGVRQFQFAQTGPRSYELRLTPENVECTEEMNLLLRPILGADAVIGIRCTNMIPPKPSGKLPVVVNEMKQR